MNFPIPNRAANHEFTFARATNIWHVNSSTLYRLNFYLFNIVSKFLGRFFVSSLARVGFIFRSDCLFGMSAKSLEIKWFTLGALVNLRVFTDWLLTVEKRVFYSDEKPDVKVNGERD